MVAKKFGLPEKFFPRLVKTQFYVCKVTSWGKTKRKTFLIHNFFSYFQQNIFSSVVKTLFSSSEEDFGKEVSKNHKFFDFSEF